MSSIWFCAMSNGYPMPMSDVSIAATILPIFAVIALGYVAVRARAFPRSAVPYMGQFVVGFCLPALVFTTVSRSPINEVINPWYVGVYALGGLLTYWIVVIGSRYVAGESLTAAGGNGLGSSVSNSAFVGAPVLIAVYGSLPANGFTMNLLVENIVMLPTVLVVFELAKSLREGGINAGALTSVFRNLLRNPILLALLAGLVLNLSGLRVAEPVYTSLGFLVDAAIGVALFTIGGSLVGTALRGSFWSIGSVAAGKLVLHPLIVAGLVWLAPPFDPELERIAILSAAMPMMSIYPVLAGRYQPDNAYAATLMVTTLLSMITLSIVLLALY